jgi:hypothetical protein
MCTYVYIAISLVYYSAQAGSLRLSIDYVLFFFKFTRKQLSIANNVRHSSISCLHLFYTNESSYSSAPCVNAAPFRDKRRRCTLYNKHTSCVAKEKMRVLSFHLSRFITTKKYIKIL